jgi:hypothetical protein
MTTTEALDLAITALQLAPTHMDGRYSAMDLLKMLRESIEGESKLLDGNTGRPTELLARMLNELHTGQWFSRGDLEQKYGPGARLALDYLYAFGSIREQTPDAATPDYVRVQWVN